MLDDFTPIIHTLPGRTIRCYAVGDVHIGAKECDLEGFQSFLRKVQSEEDSYLFLLGDLLNNGLRSPNCPTDIYSETMPPHAQVKLAAELLTPLAGKILGCVGGNHERRTRKETDIDIMAQVMTLIGKPDLYRPNMAFIRVNLTNGKAKDHYGIMLTHGKTLNKRKNFQAIVEGIDAAIFAHTHTPDVLMPSRIRFGQNNNITVREIVSITACSWLKPGGYSLSGLYAPQAISRPQSLILEFVNSNDIRGKVRVEW